MARQKRKVVLPYPRNRGFTLIEIVVVMVLLAIIAGSVGLNLIRDPAAEVREDAERLAILINMARDQAILEGRYYGVRIHEKGYAFARLNGKGELKTIEDDALLRKRDFSDDVLATEITIDGKSTDIADSGFIVTPIGQVPSFVISLSHHDARWQVHATEEGAVQAGPPNE